MKLSKYLSSEKTAAQLARELGVADATVSNWRSGKKFPSAARCVRIEQITGRAVRRSDLRPDWRILWPELAVRGGGTDKAA